ncbi:MBL fold metallo-hydrolase [Allokutzneria sp. NRRL B-24872]|uniref:MBL fold metallo-hydrolase n=1 Tax=Allokutzneria sp. NRRL B-24872 TaxID=1137961 RepID=UPI001AEF7D48|nr:MBL fold metallo-hydrolase [Allokutzneria sp. NRRL B-24872]
MISHPAYGELRAVTPYAAVLLAENPSGMTLEGTNTWLLRAPGAESCVVVDPGPADDAHLERIAANGPVELIVLTHFHGDHSDGAARLAELVGAPIRAIDPKLCVRAEALADGEVVRAAGLDIKVVATPGHTADSLCLLVQDAVFTGDSILGRGTTVVAHPDGSLAPYLDSLRWLASLPKGTPAFPGHGPEVADVVPVAEQYLAHRVQRLEQVRGALDTLGADATARQVVELVYAEVDKSLWWAAEMSVHAQLDYLRAR